MECPQRGLIAGSESNYPIHPFIHKGEKEYNLHWREVVKATIPFIHSFIKVKRNITFIGER